MKRFLTNGKFAVKWILRLLPIILLITSFIYFTVASNQSYEAINQLDGYNPLNNFWNSFDAFINQYSGDHFFEMLGLTQNTIDFLTGTFNIESTVLVPLDLVVSIMVYELFLSFIFLIFDVFNYMFTICSKFLNKGENINE